MMRNRTRYSTLFTSALQRSAARCWLLWCCYFVSGWLLPAYATEPNPFPASDNQLVVFSESLPPFVDSRSGDVEGVCVDRTKAILAAAGYYPDIQIVPWARAVQQVNTQRDSLIMPMVKTDERSKSYIWLAKLASLETYLYGLQAQPPRILTLTELQYGRLVIGAVRQSYRAQYLVQQGLVEGKTLVLANSYPQLYELLRHQRVQFIAAPKEVMLYYGYTEQLYEAMVFPDSLYQNLYLATSENSSPLLIAKLKAAAAQLNLAGE